jgi:hypothetical protein
MTDEAQGTGAIDPTLEEEHEELAAGNGHGPTPDSIFEELQAEYARSAVDRTKTIQIAPGRYKGRLAVRLRPTEEIWKDYRKRAERMESRGGGVQAMLDFAATTIVQCCETILYRPTDEAELLPMHECTAKWSQQQPIKFDERLCEAMGIALAGDEKATQICRLVFKTDGALDEAFTTADAWLKEQIPSDVAEDGEEEGDAVRPT